MNPNHDRVRELLARWGPTQAGALGAALDLPRSTLNRAIGHLGDDVLRVGKARATRYAARRAVDGVRTPTPVYEVDGDGGAHHRLTLHPVAPTGFWVESHDPRTSSTFEETDPRRLGADPAVDLPWYLLDLKPEGYLGRAWLAAHPGEGFPTRLARWTGDDVLRYATTHGAWLPGAWIVGAAARNRFVNGPVPDRRVPHDALPTALVAEAERTALHGPRGSSPGGEQPKFALVTERDGATTHQLVKFTAPMDTPSGRRWADLLALEHLTHGVLVGCGVASCRSAVVDAGGRRFLLIERFDRHGERGRSGVTSLASLDRDGVAAELRPWSSVTRRLADDGAIAVADHARVTWLEAFGVAIANTDMHPGNLAFCLQGTTLAGLAPVYDMLPMAFAPAASGEVRSDPFDPFARRHDLPPSAVDAARTLWERGAVDARVSGDFRRVCANQANRLR